MYHHQKKIMKTELLAALDSVLRLANETYLCFVGTFQHFKEYQVSFFVYMETTAGVMGAAKRGQWRAIEDFSRAAVDGSKWRRLQMKDSTWEIRWASPLNGLKVLCMYSAKHREWRVWRAIGCHHWQDHPPTKRSYQGSVLLFHLVLYNRPVTFVFTKFRFRLDAMVLTVTTHQSEVTDCSFAW